MIEKSDAVARDIKAMARSIEALEEAGADVHTIDVSLGDRGFVRLLANGEIEFHLSHIPDEELYPGQKDPVIFKPNAEDANLFQVLADHLHNFCDEIGDKQSTNSAPRLVKKKPAQPELAPQFKEWVNK
jgi:hypothetical protein